MHSLTIFREGCPITHTFSIRESRELCDTFQFVEVRKAHIFRFDVEAYKKGQYVVRDEWKGLSEKEIADMEEEIGWHTMIQANKEK